MTGSTGGSTSRGSAKRRRPSRAKALPAALYRAPSDAPEKPGKRRFRSDHVVFGALGAVILACCGYGVYRDQFDRQCVDPKNQQVIDASYCRHGGHGAWYYGGYRSGIGTKATGGSFERGGFGSRFFGGGS